jgi:hypothetical protein
MNLGAGNHSKETKTLGGHLLRDSIMRIANVIHLVVRL